MPGSLLQCGVCEEKWSRVSKAELTREKQSHIHARGKKRLKASFNFEVSACV